LATDSFTDECLFVPDSLAFSIWREYLDEFCWGELWREHLFDNLAPHHQF
jgi:hypothetical protein